MTTNLVLIKIRNIAFTIIIMTDFVSQLVTRLFVLFNVFVILPCDLEQFVNVKKNVLHHAVSAHLVSYH